MKIIDKYLVRKLVLFLLGTMGVLVTLVLVVDLFDRQLGDAIEHRASVRMVAMYYLYFLPTIVVWIAPIALSLAVLFVLGGLVRSKEYVAMLAGGISLYRILVPLTSVALLFTVAMFIFDELVLPPAMRRANAIDEAHFSDKRSAKQRPRSDIAMLGSGGKVYFFQSYDPSTTVLEGITILSKRQDSAIAERIDARSGQWHDEQHCWIISDGTRRRFDQDGALTAEETFGETRAPIDAKPDAILLNHIPPNEKSFWEIRRDIRRLVSSGLDAFGLTVEYHMKFALPLSSLVVFLLVTPFALDVRQTGLTANFSKAIAAAIVYFAAIYVGVALGRTGALPAWVGAWIANIVFGCLAAALLLRART